MEVSFEIQIQIHDVLEAPIGASHPHLVRENGASAGDESWQQNSAHTSAPHIKINIKRNRSYFIRHKLCFILYFVFDPSQHVFRIFTEDSNDKFRFLPPRIIFK